MRILFTVSSPQRVGGLQTIIRDIAPLLQERGHAVWVFGAGPVSSAEVAPDNSIPITSNPDDLPLMPDVIHAHHHLDAMIAVMAFPGVPAIYGCHGATHTQRQPRHPRILRYTTMTATSRLRMAIEDGICEDDIEVVYNSVNLRRFRFVRTPPDRPHKALVYLRNFDPDTRVGRAIREAADLTGLEPDYLGLGNRLTPTVEPERVLPRYDLVFTSGKSAIDALACGCAVIVLGQAGIGDMVTRDNFDDFREANFSIPVNSPPANTERVVAEISKFSSAEVAATSHHLRRVANMENQVDQYLANYIRVIDRNRQTAPDHESERRAIADYFRQLAPWVQLLDCRAGEARQDGGRRDHLDGPLRQLETIAAGRGQR